MTACASRGYSYLTTGVNLRWSQSDCRIFPCRDLVPANERGRWYRLGPKPSLARRSAAQDGQRIVAATNADNASSSFSGGGKSDHVAEETPRSAVACGADPPPRCRVPAPYPASLHGFHLAPKSVSARPPSEAARGVPHPAYPFLSAPPNVSGSKRGLSHSR